MISELHALAVAASAIKLVHCMSCVFSAVKASQSIAFTGLSASRDTNDTNVTVKPSTVA